MPDVKEHKYYTHVEGRFSIVYFYDEEENDMVYISSLQPILGEDEICYSEYRTVIVDGKARKAYRICKKVEVVDG